MRQSNSAKTLTPTSSKTGRPDTLEGLYIIDGAMATELERRGADLNHTLWSARVLAEQPALIESVHYDYFAAGADIATTASYQATFAGFARCGLDADRSRELLQLSVQLACDARDRFWANPGHRTNRRYPLVAAAIGPYGAHLHDGSEYAGNYAADKSTLADFHRRQLEVLARSKANLIAFETVPSRHEAEAIMQLLEEFPEQRAWISFSCRNSTEVSHGETFRDCVAMAGGSSQVLATGLNCTAPEFVASLLASAAPVAAKPLLAYPNSGEKWHAADNSWTGAGGMDDIAGQARHWRAAGASLVGGCCRTTPAHIRQIAGALREH